MHHGTNTTNGIVIQAAWLPSACYSNINASKLALSVVSKVLPRTEGEERELKIDMGRCRRVAGGKPCNGVS